MEYKDIFKPETLGKLNKQSAENLKTLLGDKSLMQTLISSGKLLQEIMVIEEPFKGQLEELAIQMVEDMYPIIGDDNIQIDAKIVSMADVNQSLDEIKINNPKQKLVMNAHYQLSIKNKILKDVLYFGIGDNDKHLFYDEETTESFSLSDDNIISIKKLDEIKINKPGKYPHFQKWKDDMFPGVDLRHAYELKDIRTPEEFLDWTIVKGFTTKSSRDYNLNKIKGIEGIFENSPEAKRRVINGITQGAALKGTFSFYMFKEYLDAIDPSLVEKYNQLMKEVFGVYDDENAIAMFLQQIAMGNKMGGGSSKVVVNESQTPQTTIKARAICFPMLVHEIIKGLYELVSLQGFSDTKDQNQQVVDKVDKLEHEPLDIRYGQQIFDALNNVFADSDYDESRIREFFFADVYQLPDSEFVEFVENAINEELTSSQKRWVEQILKSIQLDLRDDDFNDTGLDEIKVKKNYKCIV